MKTDPLEQWLNADVTLTVRLPRETGRVFRVTLGQEAAVCLAPLPRDREIPFMPMSYDQARERKEQREQIARDIARSLTAELLKAFGAQDTINGYTPEEWAAINRRK